MTMRTLPQRRVTVAAISGSDREALHQIGYIPLCVVNCLGSLPSRATQSSRQAGICDQFCHAIREGLGVTLGDNEARDAVDHSLSNSSRIRRDDWTWATHRFDRNQAIGLVTESRVQDNVGGFIET